MPKPKKYPVYNPDTDGNYFEWILHTAALIRNQNKSGQGTHLPRPR